MIPHLASLDSGFGPNPGIGFVAGFTDDGHIHGFSLNYDYSWETFDVTSKIGGQTFAKGALIAWDNNDTSGLSIPRMAGVSSDGHIHVFTWIGTDWGINDVTRETGGQTVDANALTSWDSGKIEHVAAISSDGHIHVYWWDPSVGHWQTIDATAEAGGQTVATGVLVSWSEDRGPHPGNGEYIAGISHDGNLFLFIWEHTIGHWRPLNLGSGLTQPLLPIGITESYADGFIVYAVSKQGHIFRFSQNSRIVDVTANVRGQTVATH
jgi:hypothetical protein